MENKVKILIAENNEFGQNCAREFSSYGYNALLSDKDGAQVLTKMKYEKPDVIIMDAFMLHVDALGVIQADTGDEGREKADADCSFKRG